MRTISRETFSRWISDGRVEVQWTVWDEGWTKVVEIVWMETGQRETVCVSD